MKKLLIIMLVFASITGFSQSGFKLVEPENLYKNAISYQSTGEYDKSLELIDQINENDSIYMSSILLKVEILLSQKRYSDIIEVYNQNINISGEYYFNLSNYCGLALLRSKKYEEAIEFYNSLINIYPKNYLCHYNLGVSYDKNGDIPKAVQYYKNSILYNAYYSSSHLSLGNICFQQGNITQALMCWNMYLIINPDSKNSLQVLNGINDAVSKKNKENSSRIEISSDDASFRNIDMVLKSLVSLDKNYKTPLKISAPYVKQNYAMMDLLKDYKGEGGFWSDKYVPIYQKTFERGSYNLFVLRTLLSSTDSKIQKYIKKEGSKIDEFVSWFADEWTSILGANNVPENPELRYYYTNTGELSTIGMPEINDNFHGEYNFFINGRLNSIGSFNNGNRSGEWKWYNKEGIIIEELTYDSDGNPNGKLNRYHENGVLKNSTNLIGKLYQGEYKSYNKYGFLLETAIFKDDFYDGTKMIYHNLGVNHIQYLLPYKEGNLDGIVKKFYKNANLETLMEYKEGLRINEEKQFFYNGNLSYLYTYNNDELNGPYKSYYISGKLHKEGSFVNGLNSGKWITYDEEENVIEIVNYSEGKKQGENIGFNSDGSKHYIYIYDMDLIDSYQYFDKTGKVLVSDDKIEGNEFKSYYSNGNLGSNGNYSKKQLKTGIWKYYNIYGKVISSEENKEGLLNGPDSSFYTNGNLAGITFYKDGKPHGKYTVFYINGVLQQIGFYKDGEAQRVWKTYYPDGTIMSETYYKDGIQVGYQYNFNVNGEVKSRDFIENQELTFTEYYDSVGKIESKLDYFKDTLVVLHYPNGSIKIEMRRRNGYLHGEQRRFYPNGQLEFFGSYFSGDLQGKAIWYFDNGQISIEGNYDSGYQIGEWNHYFENGNRQSYYYYKHDLIEGNSKHYNEEGILTSILSTKGGELDGTCKYYNANGKLQMIRYYEENELIGYSYLGADENLVDTIPIFNGDGHIKTYFSNGNLAREFDVVGGEFEGVYTTYYLSGQVQSEDTHNAGYRMGEDIEYYENGNVKKKCIYLNDELHGELVEYYLNGQVKKQMTYKNGEPLGKVFHFNEQGNLLKEEVYKNGELYNAFYH